MPSPGVVPVPLPAPVPFSDIPQPSPPFSSTGNYLTELHARVSELHRRGSYNEATPVAEEYVDVARGLFGEQHATYAAALTALSIVYRAQGRYTEAEPIARKALAIHEKKLGREHLNVVGDLDNLAQLLQEQDRFSEAGPLYKRALAIAEATLPPGDPRVAGALNNLAWFYQAQGRYREAEPIAKKALAIVEKSLGTNHEDAGRINDTLALIYEGQGQRELAEPHYKSALLSLENKLGFSHPEVAVVRGNLGGLYKSQGRLVEAEPLLESSNLINQTTLGERHPALARSLTQLADLYRLQGRCEKAGAFFVRAGSIAGNAIKDVAVLYGTDRRRDTNSPTVAFGGERDKLSYGLTTVALPSDQQVGAVRAKQGAPSRSDTAQAKAARRLSMHCIQVMSDEEVVTAASRLASPQAHPNQALVFVHGYNVSFESGLRRAAQIAHDTGFDGRVFLFSWPARGTFMDYLSDREVVDLAADHLQDFIERIVSRTQVTKVHFVAHSMGNMVLLRALERGAALRTTAGPAIGEIISASPDVDPDVFVQFVGKIRSASGTTLYASRSDWPLWFSSWMRDRPRAGFIRESPLIAAGLRDHRHYGCWNGLVWPQPRHLRSEPKHCRRYSPHHFDERASTTSAVEGA